MSKILQVDPLATDEQLAALIQAFFSSRDGTELVLRLTQDGGPFHKLDARRATSKKLIAALMKEATIRQCSEAPLATKMWGVMQARFFDVTLPLLLGRRYHDPAGEVELRYEVKLEKIGSKLRGLLVSAKLSFLTMRHDSLAVAKEEKLLPRNSTATFISRKIGELTFPLATNWTLS